MAKQTSRNRRASQTSTSSQTRADEIRSLKASLTDLQSKRLSALRLYQEEKVLRQSETARADHLSSQLKNFENAAAHPQTHPNPTNVVTTDSFIAELRGLGRVPSIPFASLTWHCLAMADLLTGPPDVLAVLHPTASVEGLSTTVNNTSAVMSVKEDAPVKRRPRSSRESGCQIPPDFTEDIEKLTKRLQQLEAEAEAARQSVRDNEHLVSDLRSQLNTSTAACNDLMQTVKQQRETIERLS